ncbi:uncharacterized protein LOC128878792 isoform X1 [Hylaeus volcanicus]|uniref:uncharacterized protein LOC128878792 isoform X1 n=2 Tax=Hylaeus volcanicus TaxID=313075 RepID=UPI0023B80E76|nr:uncharacterized protein LOC128878792 isoform X1 [Hylaeus volcanicus]
MIVDTSRQLGGILYTRRSSKSKSKMQLSATVMIAILVSCHAFMRGGVEAAQRNMDIENYDKNGMLVGFLEKFKDILKTGNSEFGIPVLDPLQVNHVNVNLNEKELIELSASLDNLRGVGLSAYTVNQGDFKLVGFQANISLTWSEMNLMTRYNVANGKIVDTISFYGDGIIAAVVKGLTVDAVVHLGISEEKKIYVKNLALHVHLKELDFKITGLYNDAEMSKLVSTIASEITPQLIEDYQDNLMAYVTPSVVKMMNTSLKDLTIQKLLDIINGKS